MSSPTDAEWQVARETLCQRCRDGMALNTDPGRDSGHQEPVTLPGYTEGTTFWWPCHALRGETGHEIDRIATALEAARVAGERAGFEDARDVIRQWLEQGKQITRASLEDWCARSLLPGGPDA